MVFQDGAGDVQKPCIAVMNDRGTSGAMQARDGEIPYNVLNGTVGDGDYDENGDADESGEGTDAYHGERVAG